MCNTAVNSCARAPFPRHDEDDGMVITETLSLFVSCLYLCSRVAYEAYENVPNPTKKRKWAKNEEDAPLLRNACKHEQNATLSFVL